MSIRKRDYQFRLVWRRQGDKHDRVKVFNEAYSVYKYINRLCGACPWHGAQRITLRQVWATVARQRGIPVGDVLSALSTRDASLAVRDGNRPLLWLRIETRQVAKWTEMLEPMEVLKPKAWANTVARAEAYCDLLDRTPALRWVPPDDEVK